MIELSENKGTRLVLLRLAEEYLVQESVKDEEYPQCALLEPLTLQIDDRVSVRLYRDSRPCCLEIAPLQKGLVLMLEGRELIEEGVGFGVPVVKYNDKTYFSSSAECSISKNGNSCTLTKSFVLDTISRKRVWKSSYVNDDVYRFFHRSFEALYLRHRRLFPIFDTIMQLRSTFRIRTEFVKTHPQGRITVAYLIKSDSIEVKVDLSDLDCDGCREILILNEQGSTFFMNYSDADGSRLLGEKMGAWSLINAKEASLSHVKGTLTFTLFNKRDSTLFRGWEQTKGRFAWTGLNYSLTPQLSVFDYVIKLTN